MKQAPRILLACPISAHKDYILFDWAEHVKGIRYKIFDGLELAPDILLIDNSHDKRHAQKVREKTGLTVHRLDPGKKGIRHYMADSLEIIRTWAIQQRYDYFFSLECDIFPPAGILSHLLGLNLPVISATYFIDLGARSTLCQQILDGNTHATAKNVNPLEGFLLCRGQVQPVYMPGLGCCLIHKTIFRRFKFYATNADTVHADSNFFRDLYLAGLPAYTDFSIICRHDNRDWNEIYKTEKLYTR